MNYLCPCIRPIPLLEHEISSPTTYSRTSSPQFSPISYIIIFSCSLLNYSHSHTNMMQFLPSYKNTVWSHSPLQLSPHFFAFLCSKTLWKCYLYWLYPVLFLPFPLIHSIQDFIPNYSTKTAFITITSGFCISKSRVNSQISSYLTYHHHLTLLITPSSLIHFHLASRTPYTLVFPPTLLALPSQTPLLVLLLLLVLLIIEFFRALLHKHTIFWLFHSPHGFNYHLYAKESQIHISTPDLSFLKPNLIYSTSHVIEWIS